MTEAKDRTPGSKFSLQELLNSWAAQLPATNPCLAEDIVTLASRLLAGGQVESLSPETIRTYLNLTSTSTFLRCLPYPQKNWEWAETCFGFIQKINYNLLDLFEDRVKENPDRILFLDLPVYFKRGKVDLFGNCFLPENAGWLLLSTGLSP